MPPSTATERPNQSPAAPSEAVSLAVSVALAQPKAGLVNRYADPEASPLSSSW